MRVSDCNTVNKRASVDLSTYTGHSNHHKNSVSIPVNNDRLGDHPPVLQRSLTSSAILMNTNRNADNSSRNTSLEANGKMDDTNNSNSNNSSGPISVEKEDAISGTNSQSSNKFSMPGLFKKIRGGVTSPKYNHVQPKQSYIHPHKVPSTKKESVKDSRKNQDKPPFSPASTNTTEKQTPIANSTERNGVYGKSGTKSSHNRHKANGQHSAETHEVTSTIHDVKADKFKDSNGTNVYSKTMESDKNKRPRTSNNNKVKGNKDCNGKRFGNLPSPTSPKPLVRALGKFKFLRGANAISNNNSTGEEDNGSDSGGSGSKASFNPLQKSSSVGHNVFTSVVQDCGKL